MASLTPTEKVVALLNSFNTTDHGPIAYINPKQYIQHIFTVADGLAGFANVMKNAPPQGFLANVVRACQDGNYVITHTEYNFLGPKIGFDIFRFEDGLTVEHWDILETLLPRDQWKHDNGKLSFGNDVMKASDRGRMNGHTARILFAEMVTDFMKIVNLQT